MAWSATLNKLEKYDDGVKVHVTISNGSGYSVDIERPVFRPSSRLEVIQSIKNMIVEFKARKQAEAVTDKVVTNMADDIGGTVGE